MFTRPPLVFRRSWGETLSSKSVMLIVFLVLFSPETEGEGWRRRFSFKSLRLLCYVKLQKDHGFFSEKLSYFIIWLNI